MLDPEMADLARELIDNADRQRSAFMSFVNIWMAFNGWMESVTDANSDAAMITALAENARAIDAYDTLVHTSPQFRRRVELFSGMWPVLNVRDVRRTLGRDAFWQFSRDELLEACVRQNVKLQPVGWADGSVPSWAQVLRTVYMVRCNMFHGSKSPQNLRDRDLVLHSDRILRAFIDQSGCFDWYD